MISCTSSHTNASMSLGHRTSAAGITRSNTLRAKSSTSLSQCSCTPSSLSEFLEVVLHKCTHRQEANQSSCKCVTHCLHKARTHKLYYCIKQGLLASQVSISMTSSAQLTSQSLFANRHRQPMKAFASSQVVPGRAASKLANAKTSSTGRKQQQQWVSISCTDNDFTHLVYSCFISTVAFRSPYLQFPHCCILVRTEQSL